MGQLAQMMVTVCWVLAKTVERELTSTHNESWDLWTFALSVGVILVVLVVGALQVLRYRRLKQEQEGEAGGGKEERGGPARGRGVVHEEHGRGAEEE